MHFKKDLDRELVPEWRAKYLDYKTGKKKVKRIRQAFQKSHPGGLPQTGSSAYNALVSVLTPSTSARNFSTLPGNGSQASFEPLPGPALDPAAGATPAPATKEANPAVGAITAAPEESHNDTPKTPGSSRRKTLSRGGQSPSGPPGPDVRTRQQEFLDFLAAELEKVNSFYLSKEQEAVRRMDVLRDQLHLMKAQRVMEIGSKTGKTREETAELARQTNGTGLADNSRFWSLVLRRQYLGKNTRALAQMDTPSMPAQTPDPNGGRRDFERRQAPGNDNASVHYKDAKRQLKYALKEFYRGMDLLRNYANLNEKAFRKLNKKYNKLENLPKNQRLSNVYVDNAAFVTSDRLHDLMVGKGGAVDLYTRYFTSSKSPAKALEKLRQPSRKPKDYSNNQFVTGSLLMGGLILGILGLLNADKVLYGNEGLHSTQVSYLLQIYGGFVLVVYHALLFGLACMIWTKANINFKFVLEYNTRHTLDWREILMFVSIFWFLLGLVVFLNFHVDHSMFLYWPVLLVGITTLILFFPAPYVYHHARWWFARKNFFLFLPGFRKVFFIDLFFGDMYCSQTYTMGNIELFFCLYAHLWREPTMCNSSHSRVLGFLTTLPSIIRALQCIRRYWDSHDIFPHLFNTLKYIFGIVYYMTLSLYRIEGDVDKYRTPFIIFAFVNAAYTSLWDVGMDWSLGSIFARPLFLRDHLAFNKKWVYYTAVIFNCLIRFNWIAYAVYLPQIQHSSLLSFIVALTEVTRRGIWTIFRIENEHCTNVSLYRAGRDVELPYAFITPEPRPQGQEGESQPAGKTPTPKFVGASGLQVGGRRASGRIGATIASAHAQDFERKELPTSRSFSNNRFSNETPSSDEEDDANIETSDDEPESSVNRRASARRASMTRISE